MEDRLGRQTRGLSKQLTVTFPSPPPPTFCSPAKRVLDFSLIPVSHGCSLDMKEESRSDWGAPHENLQSIARKSEEVKPPEVGARLSSIGSVADSWSTA